MSTRTRSALLIVIGLLLIAAVVYLVASGVPGRALQLRQLDAQASGWNARHLTSYEMKVHIGCFCPFYDRMPLTVTVRDGRVESVVDSQGQTVPADDPVRMYGNEQLMTIEGVFAYTRQAVREADETKITYDATLGFPAQLSIDRIKLAMDDEMSVLISDLRPLQ